MHENHQPKNGEPIQTIQVSFIVSSSTLCSSLEEKCLRHSCKVPKK